MDKKKKVTEVSRRAEFAFWLFDDYKAKQSGYSDRDNFKQAFAKAISLTNEEVDVAVGVLLPAETATPRGAEEVADTVNPSPQFVIKTEVSKVKMQKLGENDIPSVGDYIELEIDAGGSSNAPWTSKVTKVTGEGFRVSYDDGTTLYEFKPDDFVAKHTKDDKVFYVIDDKEKYEEKEEDK